MLQPAGKTGCILSAGDHVLIARVVLQGIPIVPERFLVRVIGPEFFHSFLRHAIYIFRGGDFHGLAGPVAGSLDTEQVVTSAAIRIADFPFAPASSVPDLPAKNVTVVDQDGNLLSDSDKPANANTLDAALLKYVQELQQSIVRRVESIVTPIVGANNVRAEATADVDFSRTEQAAETYKPNGKRDNASIRSQQSSEASGPGNASAGGIPGALSNQPQPNATAPINGQPPLPSLAGAPQLGNARKNSTVNYEVDKTIRYTQQPMGGVRRLSVAVVLNYRTVLAKNGKTETRALTDAEKAEMTDLIKEAMGFSKERGDSVSVLNSPFVAPEKEAIVEPPIWKNPE